MHTTSRSNGRRTLIINVRQDEQIDFAPSTYSEMVQLSGCLKILSNIMVSIVFLCNEVKTKHEECLSLVQ